MKIIMYDEIFCNITQSCLSFLHNYFDSIKLFSDLYLDTLLLQQNWSFCEGVCVFRSWLQVDFREDLIMQSFVVQSWISIQSERINNIRNSGKIMIRASEKLIHS